MKCPIDDSDLRIVQKKNIEIDMCPSCKGVWLDRGEIDKLIEGSENDDFREFDRSEQRNSQNYDNNRNPRYDNDYDDNNNHGGKYGGKKKKKSSFISEMFEF